VVVFRGTRDLGALTPAVRVAHAGSQYGRPLAGVGDFDQDGYQDLLMGLSFEGSFELLRGGAAGIDPARMVYFSVSFGSFVEPSAVAVGDTDNDGVPELLLGLPGNSSASTTGRLDVLRGGASFPQTQAVAIAAPAVSAEGFGWAVGLGDYDGDGYADAIVGAYGENASYVFRGGAGGLAHTPVVRVAGGTR
jgi:hypothetical protein